MKAFVAFVVFGSILIGGAALWSQPVGPPWKKGGIHGGLRCDPKCPSGLCPVDLTPQNKNDCRWTCEPC